MGELHAKVPLAMFYEKAVNVYVLMATARQKKAELITRGKY